MNCGPSSVTKATSSGCGSLLMFKPVRLSEFTSATVAQNQHKRCGSHCPRCTACSAVIYSDFWSAYADVLPSKRHCAVGKETGKTSYIERFNCTLRQRVSRLVRKTLSFSKKLENHIGAIWLFIHYYNASLPVCSSFPA
jgi:IS1 family transposase